MRHPNTAELLLYAEGELEEHELCLHIADCVDCKARMVDLQETYVHTAKALQARPRPAEVRPVQMQRLRLRLAEEADLLVTHLSPEDLLLSLEQDLDRGTATHLGSCTSCQDQAAALHVRLAAIEADLHRSSSCQVATERRTAALAELRARLQREVQAEEARLAGVWRWVPRLTLPRVPAFAPYATAFAVILLAIWLGPGRAPSPVVDGGEATARLQSPEVLPAAPRAVVPEEAEVPAPVRRRFELAGTVSAAPEPVRVIPAGDTPLPTVTQTPSLLATLPIGPLPAGPPPVAPTREPVELAAALPLPGRLPPVAEDSPESVLEGSWILARTGLWRESLRAGGPPGRILIAGTVASETDRLRVERTLASAGASLPLDLAISVRGTALPRLSLDGETVMLRERTVGGPVRTSLLRHIGDSARRQFRPMDRAAHENELNRFVTSVLRDDAELLARVHVLHGALNHTGIDGQRHSPALRSLIRTHLDAVDRHEDRIHRHLSEALEGTYWRHRNRRISATEPQRLGTVSRNLLRSALALDSALAAVFFGTSGTVNAREAVQSIESLLSGIRRDSRQLRAAIR